MEWLAIAVFASTCLYLIDKNQKWKTFRRVLIWGTVTLALIVGTYAAWEHHEMQRASAHGPWEDYKTAPDFIPDKTPQVKWDDPAKPPPDCDAVAKKPRDPKEPDYDALAKKYGGVKVPCQ